MNRRHVSWAVLASVALFGLLDSVALAGEGKRGFLGIYMIELNAELQAHFGAPQGTGVLVAKLEKGSPAEKAGLVPGDVLIAVNDEKVTDPKSAAQLVAPRKEGEKLTLKIIRGRKARTLTATIQFREPPKLHNESYVKITEKADADGKKIQVIEIDEETIKCALEGLNASLEALLHTPLPTPLDPKLQEKLRGVDKTLEALVPKLLEQRAILEKKLK